MITTHLLIKNDLSKIEATLESLSAIDCEVLVGDLGSTDGTAAVCQDHGHKVFPTNLPRDAARNKLAGLSKTDWQFYVEPGEVVSSGHDLFHSLEGKSKRAYIITDGMITKEIRLWKKGDCKFVNPVFESLQPDDSEPVNIFIVGVEQPNYLLDLLKWKEQSPHLAEVDYYLACQYLALKDYPKFLTHANYYLFKDGNPNYPTIMTRYYLAQINLHVNRNVHEATRNLIYCLAHKPLMSEFWCALGDCYYRAGVPEKAVEFFRMAIELGKDRPTDDPYPIELAKYDEYPNKMIDLCRSILKTTYPYRA